MLNPYDPTSDPYGAGYDPYGTGADPYAYDPNNPYGTPPPPQAPTPTPSPSPTPAGAPAPTPGPTPGGAAPGSITDPNAFRDAWLSSGGKTPADLAAFIKAHPEYGATVGGSKGDKVTIGGKTYDAILGAGAGGQGATWNDITGGSGGGGSTSTAIDPSYLAPYDASLPQIPNGPDVPNTPNFSYQDFGGFDPWAPTTAQDVYNDPSYNFRMNEGAGMIENTASARGLLNSGGTLKDLLKYGQNFASNEYSNIDTRRFNAWDAGNQNKLNTYGTNRNNAASNFATNYGLSTDRYNQLLNQSNTAYDRGVGQYTTNRDTYYANQNNPFNKLQSLAQLGMSAASQ